MIQLDMQLPKGCMDCPFRHYVADEGGEYDICGLSGNEIVSWINVNNKDRLRMDDCKLPRRESGWIPCSEQNDPDQQEIVLVSLPGYTDADGEEYVPGVMCAYTVTAPNSGRMWYGSDGRTFGLEGRLPVEPIAWMPLPKPYTPTPASDLN